MSPASVSIFLLRDPRLTACASSPEPAWLWNTDATQVLWANAAGAALLGCATVPELLQRRFAANDPAASQVARLSASLSPAGTPRLERLRGFGSSFLRPLTSTCARITLNDGTQAIFMIGAEATGFALPLAERTRRLFDGSDDAIAVFSPDGAIVYATPSGRQRTAGANTLVAFNASALAAEALKAGVSTGDTLAGAVSMVRIGQDANTLLIVQFGAPVAEMHAAAPVTPTVPVEPPSVEPPASVEPASVEPQALIEPQAEPQAPVEITAPVEVTAPVEAAELAAPSPVNEQAPDISKSPAQPASTQPTSAQPASAKPAAGPAPTIDRQHPLRFVWQMDAESKFTLASDDFITLIGPVTAQVLGKSWNDIAAILQIDAEGQVARAVATHDTWSGITVQWPVDDSAQRLKIELSGLPIYDRQRVFTGYRGFGVCRDIETFAAIARDRMTKTEPPPPPAAPEAPAAEAPVTEAPVTQAPAAEAPVTEASAAPAPATPEPHAAEPDRPMFSVVPPAQNVLPFRILTPPPPPPTAPVASVVEEAPGLNAGEQSAFSEIARQLAARLKTSARESEQTVVLRTTPGIGIDGRATQAPFTDSEPATAEAETGEHQSEHEVDESCPAAPAWLRQGSDAHGLIDKLPLGVLIYRFDTLFYANRSFLDQVGYDTLPAFVDAGGLDSLFIETEGGNPNSGSQTLTITTGNGDKIPVEGRLFSIPWNGESALALVLVGAAQSREPIAASPPAAPLRSEADLVRVAELEAAIAEAKRIAHAAAAERAELLGRITEQVRPPMSDAVRGVDTMLEERFGPIGNERYRAYLTDIRGSGMRILSLFEDLASLSKAEVVKDDPMQPGPNLNDVVKSSVARMQPEASRVRVLIRTSLASIGLPVKAEAESLSHIITNLLTSSIRFAGPGGQVIVSTAPAGAGKVSLRLRDTGAGLSDKELAEFQLAATPNAQADSADMADDTLTMAITRAMLEANHATLACTTKAKEGTLVEVTFPSAAA